MKNILNLNRNKILLLCVLMMSLVTFGQKGPDDEIENSIVRTINDPDLQWGPCPSFMPEGCNIAVLHGNPAVNNVDVLFKVNGGSFIPNHWHNSPERMILLSGELQVTYEEEEGQLMKVGSYAYGPSKKPHIAKCISKEPCILFVAFENPLDAFPIEVTE